MSIFRVIQILFFIISFQTLVFTHPRRSSYDVEKCLEDYSCQKNQDMCKCDSKCPQYGDCCHDSPYSNNSTERHKTICAKSVSIKTQCLSTWEDDTMRKKCENYSELSDPLSTVPVTSMDNAETYRNYYCAACNDVTENFLFWTVTVSCPLLHTHNHLSLEYLQNHLQYSPNEHSWGIWLSKDRKVFRRCHLDFNPENFNDHQSLLRRCIHLISTCSDSWAYPEIEEKCNQYYAPIFVGSIGYRNIHCAVCNNLNLKESSCKSNLISQENVLYYLDAERFQNSRSDILKLYINSESCGKNHIYDPFFKKCRDMFN